MDILKVKIIGSVVVASAVSATLGFIFGKKYEHEKARKEIEEVREYYANKKTDTSDELVSVKEEKPDLGSVYTEAIINNGYSSEVKREIRSTIPYIIRPDQFGEEEGFDSATLIYYADKVLVNQFSEALAEDEIEEMVGMDALNHFGEYEEDSVFVRNEEMKIDFEILQDSDYFNQ